MDDKESGSGFDTDFDYDLYAIKYGIDLRTDLTDEELAALVESENTDVSEKALKSAVSSQKSRPEQPVNPVKSTKPAKAEKKPDEEQERTANARVRMELYDWLQCIVSAILCGILIFVFVGRVIGVDGTSMLQTLQHEDKVVITDLFLAPSYGDIVVIKTDAFGDTPIVKRVIATAGQTIDIDFTTGEVMIDGKIISEPYINALTTLREDFEGPKTIPDGYVFVMGDNRDASTDSRDNRVGLVDTRQIIGKVLFVLIPGQNSDGTRTFARIGSVYR